MQYPVQLLEIRKVSHGVPEERYIFRVKSEKKGDSFSYRVEVLRNQGNGFLGSVTFDSTPRSERRVFVCTGNEESLGQIREMCVNIVYDFYYDNGINTILPGFPGQTLLGVMSEHFGIEICQEKEVEDIESPDFTFEVVYPVSWGCADCLKVIARNVAAINVYIKHAGYVLGSHAIRVCVNCGARKNDCSLQVYTTQEQALLWIRQLEKNPEELLRLHTLVNKGVLKKGGGIYT